MPNPWAPTRAGNPARINRAYRMTRCIRMSPEGDERHGGSGRYTVALAPMLVKSLRAQAIALFRATFRVAPKAAASAPGCIDLLGGHTAYNGGPVLPIATGERTVVVVGPGAPGMLEAVSV